MKMQVTLGLAILSISPISCRNGKGASTKSLDDLAGFESKACSLKATISSDNQIPLLMNGKGIIGGSDASRKIVREQLARIPRKLQSVFFASANNSNGWQGTIQLLDAKTFNEMYKKNFGVSSNPSGMLSFRIPSSGSQMPVIYLLDDPSALPKSVVRALSFFFSEVYLSSGSGQVFLNGLNFDALVGGFITDIQTKGVDKCKTPFGLILADECPSQNTKKVQAVAFLSATPQGKRDIVQRTVLAEAMDSYYCDGSFESSYPKTWNAFANIKRKLEDQFGLPVMGDPNTPSGATSGNGNFSLDDGSLPGESNPQPDNSILTADQEMGKAPSGEFSNPSNLPSQGVDAFGRPQSDPNFGREPALPIGGLFGSNPGNTAKEQASFGEIFEGGVGPGNRSSSAKQGPGGDFGGETIPPAGNPQAKAGPGGDFGGETIPPAGNPQAKAGPGGDFGGETIPPAGGQVPKSQSNQTLYTDKFGNVIHPPGAQGSTNAFGIPSGSGDFGGETNANTTNVRDANGNIISGVINNSNQIAIFNGYKGGGAWSMNKDNTYSWYDENGKKTDYSAYNFGNGSPWFYSNGSGGVSTNGSNPNTSAGAGNNINCAAGQTAMNGICYIIAPNQSKFDTLGQQRNSFGQLSPQCPQGQSLIQGFCNLTQSQSNDRLLPNGCPTYGPVRRGNFCYRK